MNSSTLFAPIKVGNMELQHRLAMAPLTRFRADSEHAHTDLAVEYYSQRACSPGTLIITEATFVSPEAGGYPNVPGIWSDAQIAGWKKIVDAVHAKGGFICLQLWALGRVAKPDVLKAEGGFDVVSSSDVPFGDGVTPRALTEVEIKDYVGRYAQAARNFIEKAGGDCVEVHSANGYLLDQFLQTNSNKRTDRYGGSVENRTRFGREVVAAVVEAVGASKTGIRLSPYSTFQGMKMDGASITETFRSFVSALSGAHPDLAYIHAVEARGGVNVTPDTPEGEGEELDFIYDLWTPRTFLVAGGFKAETAIAVAEKRKNTVVVMGRYFISNPDLVARIKQGVPLADYNRSTFYLYGPTHPTGYIDYPFAPELAGKL